MFEPQRRVGCRRTRRENEANAVLSVNVVPERAANFALSGSCHVQPLCTSQITRCTLRCPRGSTALVHLTTSPPHHLTTSPPHLTSRRRKKHANPPTTRCQLLLPGTEAYSVHVFQYLARDVITISSCTSQIPRCTLRCPHGSTSLVPGSSSFRFVNLFW